jgi:tRNA threonylcarbamoyladenosine biosynthesis protein TsaE
MSPQRVQALDLADEAAQEAFGTRLASACSGPALIFLEGELGAGKTTLTRGVLRGLGHRGTVKSPTYTLVEPYEVGGRRVYHLDLYRVADPAELEYLGLREMLAEGALLLVEWPERGAGWLPRPDLRLHIEHRPSGRHLRIDAETPDGEAILSRLDRHL